MIAIKSPQRTDRLIEGGADEFTVGLEMKQEVENLPGIQIRKSDAGIMLRQLPDPSQV